MIRTHSSLFLLTALLFTALLLAACTAAQAAEVATALPAATTQAAQPALTLPSPTAESTAAAPSPTRGLTTPAAADATAVPTAPVAAEEVLQPTPADPANWREFPVIPSISDTARSIYQQGQVLGRNPHAFSKIGDCQCSTDLFFVNFEWPDEYDLGEYGYLQETIDWFAGSFGRWNMTIGDGFNAAAVFSPLRANPELCRSGETPLACEIRLHNPSIAIISLEKWWGSDLEKNEKYMRQIIEVCIQNGVVPILGTKADNLEGDHSINQTVARIALEYDIPLWNFWLSVQPLENHGVQPTTSDGTPDLFHLTYGDFYNFSAPESVRSGWTMRNLTALQVLDAVWRGVSQP